MSIRDGVAKFNVILDGLPREVFVRMTELTEQSVLHGSDITGSPGIPVKSGNAKGSVVPEFIDDTHWKITATGFYKGEEVGYVRHIEENIRGVTFANAGPHFFSKTIAGLDKLFERAKSEVLAEL